MKTTHRYFDLLSYIHDVPEVRIAAHMAASTAWKIDQLIVQNSRAIFKHIRQELLENGATESAAELTTALHEADFAEQSFNEQGSSVSGPIENIRWLNAQRDQWHDLAKKLTEMTWDWQGNTRKYDIPDIDAAFLNDRPYRVNSMTQRRMKMSIQRRAAAYNWDAETAKQRFESKLARKEDKLQQVKESVDAMAGASQLMMNFALRTDDSSAAVRSKEFSALPVEIQRLLLDNAITAAGMAAEWAEDDRSLSEREADNLDDCAFNVERELKALFNTPKFKIAQQVEESTESNVG